MNAEIVKRLEDSFLRQNLAALMREQIELASSAAVEKTIQKLEQLAKTKEGGSK